MVEVRYNHTPISNSPSRFKTIPVLIIVLFTGEDRPGAYLAHLLNLITTLRPKIRTIES